MKSKKVIIVTSFICVTLLISTYNPIKGKLNNNILNDLNGEIYYTKRVDGILTLFKSMANLENEELLYSHKGQGKDSYGGYNDNIIEFNYDVHSQTCDFVVMNNGNWSKYQLDIISGKINITNIFETDNKLKLYMEANEYIKPKYNEMIIEKRKGSLYLIKDGKEQCIKKFYGIYDSKFTGYYPIGFSPDGKYLVYHSMEHLTPIGTILDNMIGGAVGHNYIMDIETGKSTRFVDASKIQWIIQQETYLIISMVYVL